jgi:Na+/H+ antiporter 1
MAERQVPGLAFAERTAWARNVRTPLREFLRTETGGAVVLLAAAVLAIVWANVQPASYEAVWDTRLSVRVGDHGLSENLRRWVTSALTTFLVEPEARREFDTGELRDRRRLALPLAAGLGSRLLLGRQLLPAADRVAGSCCRAERHLRRSPSRCSTGGPCLRRGRRRPER